MTPFLKQVAEAYTSKNASELIDYCFVFPNKRCSAFFRNYITEAAPRATLLPYMTDIDNFVMSLTKMVKMTNIKLLFILFEAYQQILKKNGNEENDVTFDRFITWGEMVLNDFNDIDRYMVDTEQIFKNIKFFREISANFLTEEQVQIINRYWRDPVTYREDARMWCHTPNDDTDESTKKNFFSLWMILNELYHNFRQRLEEGGMCYSGMAYRKAAEILKDTDSTSSLPYKKYIFVGFNALSAAEEEIFKWMRDNSIGFFFWDPTSPLFSTKGNPAMNFVGKYLKLFPADPDIDFETDSDEPATPPEVKIIGVPSAFGQVKKGASILSELIKNNPEEFTGSNARKCAVVLPDEDLCVPLVNSLPPNVRPINITMGYPMKNSPVSSLISNIIRLLNRARKIHGTTTYYFEDLQALLSHPFIRTSYPEECDEIVRRITDESIFNFPRQELIDSYPSLSELFISPETKNQNESLNEIGKLLKKLKLLTKDDGISHAFVLNFQKSFESLKKLCSVHDITLTHDTIFHLLNRLAGSETVHFEGEPLEGIQIMGLLETRVLDFENLIILSMNEQVFPRRVQPRSFIPMEMRAAYGLSTTDHQESIYAYYFYRLLTRSKRVFLLYDARTANNSGEMSRYLYQLLYAFPELNVENIVTSYRISTSRQRVIEVDKKYGAKEKSASIMEKIELFRTQGSGCYLSPSSINTYLECPLKFYLQYIGGFLADDDDMKDYVDSGLYGTIVHFVLEKLYTEVAKERKTSLFTPETLYSMAISRKDLIEQFVTLSFLTHYGKKNEDSLPKSGLRIEQLSGENELLARIVFDFIITTLKREASWKETESFEFMKGEQTIKGFVRFSPELSLNIKGTIDRIDRVNMSSISNEPLLRFIDYKTGNEPLETDSIESMFDTSLPRRAKGMLQLMIYCNAYARLYDYNKPIIPLIYRFNSLISSPLTLLKLDGEEITDYRKSAINDLFVKNLEKAIKPLFDPDVPFTQASNPEHACKYCSFKNLCDIQN